MPTGVYLLIGLLLGGFLGFAFGWLYSRSRGIAPDERLTSELKQQLLARETEAAKLRDQLSAETNALTAAEITRKSAELRATEQQAAAQKLQSDLDALRTRLAELQNQAASLSASLDAERKSQAELCLERNTLSGKLQEAQSQLLSLEKRNGELVAQVRFLEERLASERQQLDTLQQKFQKEFELVANKLLLDNSSRFNQQSSDTLDKLLGPLRENLQDFKNRLEVAHKDTVAHSTLLKDQIGRVGTEAANLAKALKGDVKALGNWGENMLDQILEKSGLQLGVHYRRQSAGREVSGDTRFLDVIIDLPDKKQLVIDSKVSLKCYEESVNCTDEPFRAKRLDDHVECLRDHFKGLGAKRYQDLPGLCAPDFVLMYIPIEAAFFAAIARAPGIFSEALERNVVLTTNSTLLATLRTAAHVWRLADQQKYALEIADRGGKLYDKFAGFVSDLQEIGRSLEYSQRLVGDASKKLHTGPGNLLGQVDKLKALGVKASKSLPADLVAQADTPDLPLLPGNGSGSANLERGI